MNTLSEWLAHAERLHPVAMDLGLERVGQVWSNMGTRLGTPCDVPSAEGAPVVITVAGTNGKGSTCALLEAMLLAGGYRVGVYGSPHLVHFEERCRLQGQPIEGQALVPHLARVEAARQGQALTYFEFTTLAIMSLLAASELDVVVLEVGLGGRLDAVNIIDADCAIITSIDLDHMDWLGPDRESIGREKAGIMRAARPVVIGDPRPPQSVLAHAQELGADVWLCGRDHRHHGDRQQWSWQGRRQRHASLAYPALRGVNQLLNASAALAALEAMRQRVPVAAQAVRVGLAQVELPGRFQILAGRPCVVLDVAHNPHAAATLAVNLDQMGFYPRTHFVWGAMADKDLAGTAAPLKALAHAWYCCELPTTRAASAQQLREVILAVSGHPPELSERVSLHADPQQALSAALAAAQAEDRIVVFGSFYTVGGVMRDGLPKLDAPHVPSAGAPDSAAPPASSISLSPSRE